MSSYSGTADRPDKARAIAAVIAVHAALAAIILTGLNVRLVGQAVERLTTINIKEPPPPPPVPPAEPAPKPQQVKKPAGAPAPKAEPAPVVAPPAEAAAPLAHSRSQGRRHGHRLSSGAGTPGTGTGAGGSGNGPGGGGYADFSRFTPAQPRPQPQPRRLPSHRRRSHARWSGDGLAARSTQRTAEQLPNRALERRSLRRLRIVSARR